jgi:hypothetical protein
MWVPGQMVASGQIPALPPQAALLDFAAKAMSDKKLAG